MSYERNPSRLLLLLSCNSFLPASILKFDRDRNSYNHHIGLHTFELEAMG